MSRLEYLKTISRGELTGQRVIAALRRRFAEIPHRLAWEAPSASAREARERLEALRDRHSGERCVVVANGPSLRYMDLSRIAGEVTFGMNRIWRMRQINGFTPSYLAVIDIDSQLEQISAELSGISAVKFLNWNARRIVPVDHRTYFIKLTYRPRFSTNIVRGIWGGHSVTNACLQIAYHLGFREVILIGKDHSYDISGTPGQVVTATGDEQNHAIPGYYAPGATWRVPDYKGEELAYKMARSAFEKDGRQVLDATEGGKLNVFRKVRYEDLF